MSRPPRNSAINEDRMLREMGVPPAERRRIQGLRAELESSHSLDSGDQQISAAICRLAANPPHQVGQMQRRTSVWLLRAFPLGWVAAFSDSRLVRLGALLLSYAHVHVSPRHVKQASLLGQKYESIALLARWLPECGVRCRDSRLRPSDSNGLNLMTGFRIPVRQAEL